MWGGKLIWLLVIIVLALGIAALIQYLRSQCRAVASARDPSRVRSRNL
jgi:hypothetical protein